MSAERQQRIGFVPGVVQTRNRSRPMMMSTSTTTSSQQQPHVVATRNRSAFLSNLFHKKDQPNDKNAKADFHLSLKSAQKEIAQAKKKAAAAAALVKKEKASSSSKLSPQQFLDSMLRSRGYSTSKYEALSTAYHNKPTPLQKASYDVHIISVVKDGDAETLQALLKVGLSPNPCNNYGESLIHMICRLGKKDLFKVMIDAGCNIQVSDDFGRTPLHDACWAAEPCFDIVDMILEADPHLLYIADCGNSLPLSYVPKRFWGEWVEFLQSKQDTYWPKDQSSITVPELVSQEPNTCPIDDPDHALPVELARMVAAGKMSPEEADYLRYDAKECSSQCDLSLDDSTDDFGLGNLTFNIMDDDSDEEDDYYNHTGGGTCTQYDQTMTDEEFECFESELADILDSMNPIM